MRGFDTLGGGGGVLGYTERIPTGWGGGGVVAVKTEGLALNSNYLVSGWGNEGKHNTAPLNKPYYDTNTALFLSFTLPMHMFAISH